MLLRHRQMSAQCEESFPCASTFLMWRHYVAHLTKKPGNSKMGPILPIATMHSRVHSRQAMLHGSMCLTAVEASTSSAGATSTAAKGSRPRQYTADAP